MTNMLVKKYDAPVDSKKRVTIRGASFTHYRIEEYSDGMIFLKPRVLVDPNLLSKNTLRMLDKSVANLKKGPRIEADKLALISCIKETSSFRQRAQLLKHAERIGLFPLRVDFVTNHAINAHAGNVDVLARRRQSVKQSLVCHLPLPAHGDVVIFGNHFDDRDPPIGKCRADHADELLHT